jgi:hypothetical protein
LLIEKCEQKEQPNFVCPPSPLRLYTINRKNGDNITGGTKRSYTTPPTTKTDNGVLFTMTVSNTARSVTQQQRNAERALAPNASRLASGTANVKSFADSNFWFPWR